MIPMSEEQGFKPGRMALAVLLIASMLILMGGAAVAPALPVISAAFPNESEFVVSLIISIPSLGVAVFGFLVGIAADRIGKVRTLIFSLAVFTVCGVSAYFLSDMNAILIGRFLLGLGMAGIGVTTTALITEYYSGPEMVKIVGLQSAAMGIGTMCLEIGGGFLAELGWREPFLIYLIGLVAFFGTILALREPQKRQGPGAIVERPVPTDWKRAVAVCYLSIFVMQILMFMYPAKIGYYVNEYLDVENGSMMSGVFLAFYGIFNAVACVLHPRIAERFDRPTRLALCYLCFMAGGVLMWGVHNIFTIMIAFTLSGIGLGFGIPTVVNWLATITNPKTSGKIMGGYTMMLNLGIFSTSFLLNPILALMGGPNEYAGMYLFGALMSFILMVAMMVYRPVYHKTQKW